MSDLLELAQTVVGSAKINFVKQSAGEFRVFSDGKIGGELEQSINVDHTIANDEVTAKVQFSLVCKDADEGDRPVLSINAVFFASYRLKKEFSEQEIDAFARVGSAYNCWPFWREYVHGSCCRLQIPPLTAPLMTAREFANLVANQSPEANDSDSATA